MALPSAQPKRSTSSATNSGEITGTRLDETAGITTAGGFFCALAGAAHVSGSGELPSVPNEEGEGEHIFVFLNQRGQDLVNGVVPPIENTLRDVTLAAEAEATLVMVNKNLDRRVELITVTLVNPELYQLLNPAERCTARFDLTRGRSRLCNIQIRRRNETRRAQNSRIQITYRYPVEKLAGRLTYRQEFNIVAS